MVNPAPLLSKVVLDKNMKNERGIITLEMLIALSIMIMTISSVILLVFGGQSASVSSTTNQEALYKASALLEATRATAQSDFSSVATTSLTNDDIYQKNIVVEDVDSFTKKVTSNVTWDNNQISLSTIISDWNSVLGSCNAGFTDPANWKSPKVYFSGKLANYASGTNTDGLSIYDIKAYGSKLYVAAYGADSTDYTFYIFDLPDNKSQPPVFKGALDNAPTLSTGLNALTIYGNYAYVANGYTGSSQNCTEGPNCAQLQIIDISNSANPAVVKNLKIQSITTSGKLAAGINIFYKSGYIYLALAKVSSSSPNGEFIIVDVKDPLSPVIKGNYIVGSSVNAIFVEGKYAYAATPNTENLIILDIEDPTNPYKVGGSDSLTAGGANGKSIDVLGGTAYLGRTFGTNELYAFNVQDASNISVLGSKDIGTGNQTSVNGLAVKNNLAFLITNTQFQIWDVFDSSNITPWSADGTSATFLSFSDSSIIGNSATRSRALNCTGNYIYLGLQDGSTKDYLAILGQHE